MFTRSPTQLDGAMTSAAASAASAESAPNSSPESGAEKKAPAESQVREFKVNGKVVKVDLSNQLEVEKLLQLGLASGDKFQEAAKLRKEAEEIIGAAKTDKSAAKALRKAGFSEGEIKDILEKELAGYYEEEALTPEDRARRERERKLEEFERKEKELEAKEKMTKQEQEIAREVEALESDLLGALEKSSLPRTPVLAKWATQYMAAFDAQGVTISADQAVKMVEKEFPQLISSVLSQTTDVQQLKALLGKDVVKKLLDDSVAAVRKAEQPFAKEKQISRETSGNAGNKPRQKESMNNYFERLRRGEV
jgi:DNA-binding transcriptional MerR regulator